MITLRKNDLKQVNLQISSRVGERIRISDRKRIKHARQIIDQDYDQVGNRIYTQVRDQVWYQIYDNLK